MSDLDIFIREFIAETTVCGQCAVGPCATHPLD